MLEKIKQFKCKFKKIYTLFILMLTQLYVQLAWAGLPPSPQNADFSKGDFIAGVWDLIAEIFKYGSMVLAGVAFFGYGYTVIGAFIEAKKQREWGHFSMVAIIGAFVVIVAIVIATVVNSNFTSSSS